MSGQAPSGVPSGEWKQAALLAVKKGIPLSRETVAPLREVLYGIPLHQKLTSLREQAETFLSQPGASSTPMGRTLQQTVQLLETVLGMGEEAMEAKGTTLTPSSSLMAEEIQGGNRPPSAAVAARGSVPEEIADFRASVPFVPPKEADGNLKVQETSRGNDREIGHYPGLPQSEARFLPPSPNGFLSFRGRFSSSRNRFYPT
ncbi:hypothetical protein N6H14_24465 [Paenibacillus sp. CC-CFT747]|nr:hypothetical protein N6H14_24465 [Paenibacillus sp. CC-CFT747]